MQVYFYVPQTIFAPIKLIDADWRIYALENETIIWNDAELIVTQTLGLSWDFSQIATILIQENNFENVVCKMSAISSRPECVHWWSGGIWRHQYSRTQVPGSDLVDTDSLFLIPAHLQAPYYVLT